jgi:hypothetical protein
MRNSHTCSFVFSVTTGICAALRSEYHGGAISFGDYAIVLRHHN